LREFTGGIKMIKFATIGSNFIVHQFLEAAKEVAGFEYVAAYSRTYEKAEELAKQYGATKIYTDLQELALDQDIDAVYIASPNSLHCEQSILMMQHKKHVLCEKPIASNSREFEEMARVAKENNVILLEGMKSVHCPAYKVVKDNLKNLGMIRQVTFNYSQYSSRYDKYKAGIIENTFNPEFSNGALMDIGVYTIHMLLALFGVPKSIQSTDVRLDNGVDGAGAILCKYEDFLATLIYSKISEYKGNQIQGEAGTMFIDQISDIAKVHILYQDGRCEEFEIDKKVTMAYEIETFVNAITVGTSVDLLETTKQQMIFLDEARRQLGIVFPADEK